jgi:hypothetical protein
LPPAQKHEETVDLTALSDLSQVRQIPDLDERARTVGQNFNALHSYRQTLLARRLDAGLALVQQHNWEPVQVYGLMGSPRRTFTSWQERAIERDRKIPRMSAKRAEEIVRETSEQYKAVDPLYDEYLKLRTEVFRALLMDGRSLREIMGVLLMARDRAQKERAMALAAGLTPPKRLPLSKQIAPMLRDRILSGQYQPGQLLPGEWQIADEVSPGASELKEDQPQGGQARRGAGVRSAVGVALRQLAADGLVRSEQRRGWRVASQDELDAVRGSVAPSDSDRPAVPLTA